MTSAFETEWQVRFERFGRRYASEHAVSGWSREGLARRFRLFAALLPRLDLPHRARILELGCGAGIYVRYLAALGHEVFGLDYSLPSLARAIDADADRAGRYVAADARQLPLAPRSTDLVVCIGVLQALSRPDPVLDEIARVLRPGGCVVLEALNACEAAASPGRLLETVGIRRRRLRRDMPSRLAAALESRGIAPIDRIAVYLPPRRFPRLGLLFETQLLARTFQQFPRASLLVAHAVWLVGRRAR